MSTLFQCISPNGVLKLSPTTSSVNGSLPGQGPSLRCYNDGPNIAHLRISKTASPTAVITDMYLVPGVVEIISRPPEYAYAATICESGSAVVYLCTGEGV